LREKLGQKKYFPCLFLLQAPRIAPLLFLGADVFVAHAEANKQFDASKVCSKEAFSMLTSKECDFLLKATFVAKKTAIIFKIHSPINILSASM